MTDKVIFFTSSQSWTIPSDWNNAANTIEVIDGGQGGQPSTSSGGKGGDYRKYVNRTLSGSQTVTVGAAGPPSTGANNSSFGSLSSPNASFTGGSGNSDGANGYGGGAAGPSGAGGSASSSGVGSAGGGSWTSTHSPSGTTSVASAAPGGGGWNTNGGLYGGGGGVYDDGSSFTGTSGAQGIVIVTYTPVAGISATFSKTEANDTLTATSTLSTPINATLGSGGGGGGTVAWTPLNGTADFTASGATFFSGYRADQSSEVLIEAGTTNFIKQWSDFSGNGRHLTQVNAFTNFYQPLYSATGFDGALPAIMPNSNGNQGLQIKSGAGITLPLSAFVAVQVPTPNGQRLISFNNPGEADYSHNGGIFLFDENSGQGVQTLGAHSTPVTDNTNHVIDVTQTLTSNVNYLDGTISSFGVDGTSGYSGSWDCLGIACFASDGNSSSNCWGAPIGEVDLIAGTINQNLREKMQGYLAWKWGLQSKLPSGHPYKSAAPTISSGGGGSPSLTEANDTLSSTATLSSAISATFSKTEANDTLSSTATLAITATSGTTEQNDTLSSAAILGSGINATLGKTEANDTLSSTATLAIQATFSKTEANDTLVSTAQLAISATSGTTEQNDTLSSAASLGGGITATLGATEQNDTLTATSTLSRIASLAQTEANDTLVSTAQLLIQASANITERNDTLSATSVKLGTLVTASLSATEINDSLLSSASLGVIWDGKGNGGGKTFTLAGLPKFTVGAGPSSFAVPSPASNFSVPSRPDFVQPAR